MLPKSPSQYREDHASIYSRLNDLLLELQSARAAEDEDMQALITSSARGKARNREYSYRNAMRAVEMTKDALRDVEVSAENDPRCVNG